MALGAHAADKLVLAPSPDWVKPAQFDMTPSKNAAGAAVAVLLNDTQVKLTPQGSTTYVQVVATAQAPQGLQALGSVSLDWRPDTDRLIVHKLHILRAGKVIDVLGTGRGFTTLRRETKLEEAALDGSLTATIQLEGLQVGDTIDLAYSLERSDPIMRGRVQQDFLLNGAPISHLRVRALWPADMEVKPRASEIGAPLDVQTRNGVTEAILGMDDTQTFDAPKLAPPRFQRGRELELSSFESWADVSALLAPAFADAARIPPTSPLQAEIKKIADQFHDPKARAQAALALVQDQVRYVYLGLDGGGLRPATADETWSRRFGDCKGKTTLLIGMLHALGIEAEPALISTMAGDGLDAHLPMLGYFDHVLVRAVIDGRVYWLDGTRIGDRSLDDITTPPFFWALPMRTSGGALVRLETQPLATPETLTTVRLDASAGVTQPAPAHVEVVFKGDQATTINLQFSNLAPADLDKALRNFWSSQYDFIEVKSATAKFDRQTGEERLSMDGVASMDWSNGYQADGAGLGWKEDLARRPGPHADAPYAVVFPAYQRRLETIVLPDKGNGFSIVGKDVDEAVGGQVLSRRAAIKDGVFTMEVNVKSVAREIPAAQGPVLSKRMAELTKMGLYIAQPVNPKFTPQETAALLQSKPTTSGEYLTRGDARLNAGSLDDAVADFTQAIALDSTSSMAFANRGIAYAWKGQTQKAEVDFAAALKINPSEPTVFRGRGLMAEKSQRWSEAIAGYTSALQILPTDVFSLAHRGFAYLRSKDAKKALADAEAGLKINPEAVELLGLKAQAYLVLNEPDKALATADQLEAVLPDNPQATQSLAQLREAARRMRVALAEWKKELAKKGKTLPNP